MSSKIILAVRLLIAIVLLQTLRYKFAAHPDSVYIFTKVGLEPFGRIGIGVLELIAALLILFKRTVWMGSLISVGLMTGALLFHVTELGIEINGDSGKLFYMAVLIFSLSVYLSWTERRRIPIIKSIFNTDTSYEES
jgi:uncharacterized membrane protein YphA (DoxX/SURF4 family)